MPLSDEMEQALQESWDDLTAYIARRFTNEINDERWEWPREPSPRDIVGTGNLRNSLRISRGVDPGKLESIFEWAAPYAAHVHDGAVFKASDAEGNPRTLTARPWTRPVLRDGPTIVRYLQARFALAQRKGGEPR